MPLINLLVNFGCNFLIICTWYRLFTSDDDTMFLGLFVLPLLAITIYYIILLIWAIVLLVHSKKSSEKIANKVMISFFLNVVPMILIYTFTS